MHGGSPVADGTCGVLAVRHSPENRHQLTYGAAMDKSRGASGAPARFFPHSVMPTPVT